jgi:hypothetical protein
MDFASLVWRDSSQLKTAGAEESQKSDDDQIDGDNIVQQLGHYENKNAGDKRDQRTDTQGEIHGDFLCSLNVATRGHDREKRHFRNRS